MIVTTTHVIQGSRISSYLGIVVGESIIATNIMRDIVGGRAGAYEEKMQEARDIAMSEVQEKAQELGADAVVGIDIDYETVGNNMMMVSASGTAVKIG